MAGLDGSVLLQPLTRDHHPRPVFQGQDEIRGLGSAHHKVAAGQWTVVVVLDDMGVDHGSFLLFFTLRGLRGVSGRGRRPRHRRGYPGYRTLRLLTPGLRRLGRLYLR